MNFALAGRPLVIGHRGAPALAPENTLESFEAAAAAGADAIELDVGRDLVVAHSERERPAHALSLDDALASRWPRQASPGRSRIRTTGTGSPGSPGPVPSAPEARRRCGRRCRCGCRCSSPPPAPVRSRCNTHVSRPLVVRAARSRGAAVVVWTVNDPVRIAALARLGVDGIVTDDPGRAREVLATLDPL